VGPLDSDAATDASDEVVGREAVQLKAVGGVCEEQQRRSQSDFPLAVAVEGTSAGMTPVLFDVALWLRRDVLRPLGD
jgi:hypothetical protein